jgi:transcriptional regulator with XRE-family HTH domain
VTGSPQTWRVDDSQVGSLIRVVRLRRNLRQADVGRLAGVSQQTVSLAERGHLEALTLSSTRKVGRALEIRLPFSPRHRGPEAARLLDQDHATLVEQVVGVLSRASWDVLVEYSFNSYGDRGTVDVAALHEGRAALLIVEVKTRLVDIQDLLGTLDRKVRVVPGLLSAERGWRAASVGRAVVMPSSSALHTAITARRATFAAALPARNRDLARWVAEPIGPIAALWFVRSTSRRGTKNWLVGRQRASARGRARGGAAHR